MQRTYWWPEAGGIHSKMYEGGQKVKHSKNKTSESWGYNIEHSNQNQWYCIIYMKVARRVDIRNPRHKKNNF